MNITRHAVSYDLESDRERDKERERCTERIVRDFHAIRNTLLLIRQKNAIAKQKPSDVSSVTVSAF